MNIGYTTITEHYESVELRGKKSGKCLCGKRLTRQNTFSQTLSPFNKKDGRLKTRGEIYDELQTERDAWLKKPVLHVISMNYDQREELREKGEINTTLECGMPYFYKN